MTAAWRSFRDPAGRVEIHAEQVIRILDEPGAAALRSFLATEAAARLERQGDLVATVEDPGKAGAGARFIHPRLELPSFPYEWPADMLHAAARLTLRVAREAFSGGHLLKDANPGNVLFRHAAPVFVDLGSFEPWREGTYLWPAAAQFERGFLLPLLQRRLLGESPHGLFAAAHGIEPEQLAAKLRGMVRLHPLALTHAVLPALLGRTSRARTGIWERPEPRMDSPRARFVIEALFGRLERALVRLDPAADRRDSPWSGYSDDRPYAEEELSRKDAFVRAALQAAAPRRVLDIGCNDGRFSRIAAAAGAEVVAFDRDAETVGRLWQAANRESLPILPLVIDLSRPSPADGWRNSERPGFLERVRGRFDTGLFLACFHHMTVSDRIPPPMLFDLLADLGFRTLVFEYVDPADPMFRKLLRGRDALHRDLNVRSFEREALRHFVIAQTADASSTRRLYRLERRAG